MDSHLLRCGCVPQIDPLTGAVVGYTPGCWRGREAQRRVNLALYSNDPNAYPQALAASLEHVRTPRKRVPRRLRPYLYPAQRPLLPSGKKAEVTRG